MECPGEPPWAAVGAGEEGSGPRKTCTWVACPGALKVLLGVRQCGAEGYGCVVGERAKGWPWPWPRGPCFQGDTAGMPHSPSPRLLPSASSSPVCPWLGGAVWPLWSPPGPRGLLWLGLGWMSGCPRLTQHWGWPLCLSLSPAPLLSPLAPRTLPQRGRRQKQACRQVSGARWEGSSWGL